MTNQRDYSESRNNDYSQLRAYVINRVNPEKSANSEYHILRAEVINPQRKYST